MERSHFRKREILALTYIKKAAGTTLSHILRTQLSGFISKLHFDASYEEYINEMVATVDDSDRLRGIVYGWKTTLKKYEPIIEKVSTDLYREIKLLGYGETK